MNANLPPTAGRKNRSRSRLALPEGTELGRYRIGDQLGAGGFGITYVAQDTQLNRLVAIKELLPTSIATRFNSMEIGAHTESEEDDWEWAQNRFIQEAETVAACEHPNVLQVYEVFRANGTVYMVTRYEDGCNLENWLQQLGHAPTEEELRSVLLPLLSALDCVHSRGFLHRDIKPDNVYMAHDGRPVLIDFGSARQKIKHKSLPLTKIVTPGYAPFEQYLDDGFQGPATDLYALGAVMYRAITGKKPPESPHRTAPGVPDKCLRLAKTYASYYSTVFLESIDAALAPEAKDRPQTAPEWRQRITAAVPPTPSESVAPSRSVPNFLQRRPQRSHPAGSPEAMITLQPAAGAHHSVPIRLIATSVFRVGRQRDVSDYISWFWPRSQDLDMRTMHLGKEHFKLVEYCGRILVENGENRNPLTFDGYPLEEDASMILDQSGTLVMSHDYQLQVTPFVSEVDNSGVRKIGAVRFTPLNSEFAFYQPVWVLSDATFGTGERNPIIIRSAGISEVNGRIHYHGGQFWLESFAGKSEIFLNGRLVHPEEILPISRDGSVRIGQSEFHIVIDGFSDVTKLSF